MIEIVGGASITSKAPHRMLTGLRSVQATGSIVELEDRQRYRDFQMGLHGAIFGYAPDWWREALHQAVDAGVACSIAHRDERIVAEMLGQFYPDVEAVRFMLSGSDPNSAAVKIARAVTGRDRLLAFGYHGVSSAFASLPVGLDPDDNTRGTLRAEQDAYVPLDWLDFQKLDKTLVQPEKFPGTGAARVGPVACECDVAAVIVECPPDDGGREKAAQFLHACADKAHAVGALFILDEVVTGFRYGFGGAAGYYGLLGKVDLYAFGKTISNGYPISALAGKAEIMQELAGRPGIKGKTHYSGTWFGEPLGLAAARATLHQLLEEPPYDHLYELGEYLIEQWNRLKLPWKLVGHPTRPIVDPRADKTGFVDLRRHLFRKGFIVCDHPWFVTVAHAREDVDALVAAAKGWMA